MSSPIQRSSEFLFFVLGGVAIACIILIKRGVAINVVQPIAHSIDLPLMAAGMLYGGSSLYQSIRRDREFSAPVAIMIALPLLAIFAVLAYVNFSLPSKSVDIDEGDAGGVEVTMIADLANG